MSGGVEATRSHLKVPHPGSTFGQVLALQRTAGNAAVGSLLSPIPSGSAPTRHAHLITVQRNPILGDTGTTTSTVRLYHYGDLEGLETFSSPPGYPRLTDCDIITSQEEAAEYTGAPITARLRYKYELVIDQDHFEKNFIDTGTRKGYSEFVTRQKIPTSYFKRVATLTLKQPPPGAGPGTGGFGGTAPPVPTTGGSTASSTGASEVEAAGSQTAPVVSETEGLTEMAVAAESMINRLMGGLVLAAALEAAFALLDDQPRPADEATEGWLADPRWSPERQRREAWAAVSPGILAELNRRGVGDRASGEFASLLQQTKGGRALFANIILVIFAGRLRQPAMPVADEDPWEKHEQMLLVGLSLDTSDLATRGPLTLSEGTFVFRTISIRIYDPKAMATELLSKQPDVV